jgi:hypothetical protein
MDRSCPVWCGVVGKPIPLWDNRRQVSTGTVQTYRRLIAM